MLKWIVRAVLLAAFVSMVAGASCGGLAVENGGPDNNNTGDPNNNNQDNNNDNGLQIVRTTIPVRHDAGLSCGTDLIAFGTGTQSSSNVGVSYVIPSQSPTAGTPVTNTEVYDSSDFAVGGRNIFLAGNNGGALAYQVSVFNTETGAITRTFAANEIRLASIPVSQDEPGNIRANGNYCVVICDESSVTDGKIIKVINTGTNPPSLIAFDVNPSASNIQQVAVDAATKRVAVVGYDGSDTLYVYNIDQPTAAPAELVLPNGMGDVQMKIWGNYLIALDDQGYPQAFLVNLAATPPVVAALTDAEGTFDVAIGGDKFAFFADYDADDSVGGHQRAAVGTTPGPGFQKAALDNYIDGSTTNNGSVGFASSMCIVPSGTYKNYVFMAGWYLQYSAGSASFTVPADPNGVDTYGTVAWDVDCSPSVVGFKTAASYSASTDTTLGYVKLQ